ncbi:MAG TPA: ABC transporter substrate-binding protein [Methylomirabilota bacterium]|nr:ABC transporter substrate-binding protein [Methylomirabilota bacterium]
MNTAMRRIGTVLLAIVVVLSAGGSPLSAQAPKKITFLTNYVFHGRHTPYFVGLDKGFYRDAGFDVQINPATGSGFVISALEGGKADYGMAESTSVVQAVAKGARVKAFGVFMDITTSGLASLTPYPTPESILGKTVAASLTDSARVIVPIILNRKGLDPTKVNWQAADPGVYFSLLLERKVDLITASIDGDVPALTRVATPQGKTVHFAAFGDWGYDVFGYFLVTTATKIGEKPDEVRAFAAVTAKAVKYSIDHPEEAARIMVKHNPTLDEATTLAQWRQSIKAITTPYVAKNGYGVATPERLQRTIDLVRQAFKMEGTLSPGDIYADGFVAR